VSDTDLITLTADIVSAHVSHNNVTTADLPALIQSVHAALGKVGQPAAEEKPALEPAVSIRASVKPDYIVCLEDGKKLKMLKRHLRTNFGMSPDEYRAKWGLPRDYPMVAPNYAEQRRSLAHKIGLGRKRAVESTAPETETVPGSSEKKQSRKRLGISNAKAAAQVHLGTAPTPDDA
jgi:predicted transcriptional regulator